MAEERKLDAAARAQNRRRIYVSQRLPAIKAEIGQLKAERIKLKQDSTTTDTKKKAEARKRQKVVELKEIKLRPNIDTHDYDVKAKSMHRFFEEGDKVKVTLRFRGREMAHPELGMKLLNKVQADFDEVAKVEYAPRMEGRQMIMILAPR